MCVDPPPPPAVLDVAYQSRYGGRIPQRLQTAFNAATLGEISANRKSQVRVRQRRLIATLTV